MNIFHTGLDFAGMIPVVGIVADVVNATSYLAEGDTSNAMLSGIGIIPIIGDAKIAAKYADDVGELAIKGYNGVRDSNRVASNHSSGNSEFLLRLDLQTFAKKKRVSVKDDPYQRPTGFRKGLRESVYNNAKDSNGRVFDEQSKKEILPSDKWDMGHLPGLEFKKHRQSAQKRQISRKQFLDEHNDPAHYRPELPSSNRNHSDEAPDDVNFWDDIE